MSKREASVNDTEGENARKVRRTRPFNGKLNKLSWEDLLEDGDESAANVERRKNVRNQLAQYPLRVQSDAFHFIYQLLTSPVNQQVYASIDSPKQDPLNSGGDGPYFYFYEFEKDSGLFSDDSSRKSKFLIDDFGNFGGKLITAYVRLQVFPPYDTLYYSNVKSASNNKSELVMQTSERRDESAEKGAIWVRREYRRIDDEVFYDKLGIRVMRKTVKLFPVLIMYYKTKAKNSSASVQNLLVKAQSTIDSAMADFDLTPFLCSDFDFVVPEVKRKGEPDEEDAKRQRVVVNNFPEDDDDDDDVSDYGGGGGGGGGDIFDDMLGSDILGRMARGEDPNDLGGSDAEREEEDDDDEDEDEGENESEDDDELAEMDREGDASDNSEDVRAEVEKLRMGPFGDRSDISNYTVYSRPVTADAYPINVFFDSDTLEPSRIRASRDIDEGSVITEFGGVFSTSDPSGNKKALVQNLWLPLWLDYSSKDSIWANNEKDSGLPMYGRYVRRTSLGKFAANAEYNIPTLNDNRRLRKYTPGLIIIASRFIKAGEEIVVGGEIPGQDNE